MLLDVVNLKNEKISDIEISDDILVDKVRYDILHKFIVWQQAKKRSGSRKTKEIGDIRGSTRKIYKQKGTGRARHGSARAPQFRGGAVIFGPVVRSHEFKMPKKMRKLALKNAFSLKVKNKLLITVENMKLDVIKTSKIAKTLTDFKIDKCLIIDKEIDNNLKLSVRNLVNVVLLPIEGINVFDMMKYEKVIFTVNALKALEKRLT